MAVLVYADAGDLAAWTGTTAPDNADVLLRSAALLVRRDTRSAYYDTDDTGLPTDTKIFDAFRDACCAQATQWVALGVDPAAGAGGTTGGAATETWIGTGKVTYADPSKAVADARAAASSTLCDEAVQILTDAGLFPGRPYVFG